MPSGQVTPPEHGGATLGLSRHSVPIAELQLRVSPGLRDNRPMDGGLRINQSLSIPRAELSWRFSRSSGPGGQGVNTTDSRVELTFDVAASRALTPHLRARAIERLGDRLRDGTLTVSAAEHRSQLQNRQAAERRLAEQLAQAVAPPPPGRRKTKPSRSSVEKRLNSKRKRSDTKRLRRSTED